jgi:hypothetical protein
VFRVNEMVVKDVKGIGPLPKVMGGGTNVFMIGEGGRGCMIPPLVVAITRVQGLLNKVTTFSSISTRRIN